LFLPTVGWAGTNLLPAQACRQLYFCFSELTDPKRQAAASSLKITRSLDWLSDMVQYTTTILKFDKQGEKTGWTYIEVQADLAQQLQPNTKTSFRVKGKLDNFSIKAVALLPMGGGNFIMPLNGAMRKTIGKKHGAQLKVQLEADNKPLKLSEDFMTCLADEPKALATFNKIPKSVQNYFSKWIESAKTEPTKAKRIVRSVNALARSQSFSEMIREFQKKNIE